MVVDMAFDAIDVGKYRSSEWNSACGSNALVDVDTFVILQNFA